MSATATVSGASSPLLATADPCAARIFVGSLDYIMTREDLERKFGKYGKGAGLYHGHGTEGGEGGYHIYCGGSQQPPLAPGQERHHANIRLREVFLPAKDTKRPPLIAKASPTTPTGQC